MVIWLTGLAGSGKTTVGRHLYALWKPRAPNTVLVDGDDVRRILGRDELDRDYTLEGRRHAPEDTVSSPIPTTCMVPWLVQGGRDS